jgi:tRNA A37 methylthiotransferase MiaB
MAKKRFFIKSAGCRQLQYDVEKYAIFLKKNGWTYTGDVKNADLVIINTCGVVQDMEDASINYVLQVKREARKDIPFFVSGCVPKISPGRMSAIPDIRIIDKDNEYILDKLFKKKISLKNVFWNSDEIGKYWKKPRLKDLENEGEKALSNLLSAKFNNPKYVEIYDYLIRKGGLSYVDKELFEVRIADGCNNCCSYCAIKKAKGDLKSRRPSDIVRDFKYGLKRGYKNFMLVADEAGDYGSDIGTSLTTLLDKLIKLSESARFEIDYISPQSLVRQFRQLEKYFSEKKLNYFRSPIQSGSPRILKLMNRPPDLKEFFKAIDIVGEKYPWVYKLSQVIVGFPGETERDFRMTLEALKRCDFDHVKVHHYSVRAGTKAAKLKNRIDPVTIDKRYDVARSLLDSISQKKFKNRIFSELLDEIKK